MLSKQLHNYHLHNIKYLTCTYENTKCCVSEKTPHIQVLRIACSISVNVYVKTYRNLAPPSSTKTTQQYINTSDEHQPYHWYLLTKLTTYGSRHSTTSRPTTSTSQDSTTTLQSNGLKPTLRDGTTTL